MKSAMRQIGIGFFLINVSCLGGFVLQYMPTGHVTHVGVQQMHTLPATDIADAMSIQKGQ